MNWVDSEVRFMTKVVRAHDRKLFAERSRLGHINIFRQSYRTEVYEVDGCTVTNLKRNPQLICALTDNWTANGNPVRWGAEPVLAHLREIDAWNRADFLESLERQEEKARESADRDRRNRDEAWASEARPIFKEAFKDIRVANMDKTEKRRQRLEKKLESKI